MASWDLIAILQNWLSQQEDLESQSQNPGGWEKWAQGQWLTYTNKTYKAGNPHGIQIGVQQEQNAWGDAQKLDLWFQGSDGVSLAIELKCKTASEDNKAFSDRLYHDNKKLLAPMVHPYNQATPIVIGLSPNFSYDDTKDLSTYLAGFEHFEGSGINIWARKAAPV